MLTLAEKPRQFLPADFKVTDWAALEPYAKALLDYDISTRAGFDKFMRDSSEFDAVTSEDYMWRYIRTSTHTNDEIAQQNYEYYVTSISPQMAEIGNLLNKKTLASPFIDQPKDEAEELLFKRYKVADSLFRSENIPLKTEITKLSTESEQLRGAMVVELDGETMTLPKASDRLFWPDRAKREEAWRVMNARRLEDKDKFDAIYDQMVAKRHQIALNAGYKNYRDYAFDSLGRFDYTPDDCFAFHEAVEKHFVPLLTKMNERRAKRMGLDILKPWDISNDPLGRPALKAFDDVHDMVAKGIQVLDAIDPLFGNIVRTQQDMGRLDLESRPYKRPGGYNAPMPESTVPFMFANVTGKVDDVTIFIHEAGHAAHNILMEDIELGDYKQYPIEMAETASMSMELFAFDKWGTFFTDRSEKQRAQEEFLLNVLSYFPWMVQIDLFQHEVYTHPEWTIEQRHDAWDRISERFKVGGLDRSGFEHIFRVSWQRQGHIFASPFYYIEYAIAQLGALQLWRNYLKDPQKTIKQYKAGLALGYTKPLPQLYETAGITFDFSPAMLESLIPFLLEQLDQYAQDI